MKKLIPLIAAIWLCVGWCSAQNTPSLSTSPQVLVPPMSQFGYPWEVLAGSKRRVYAQVFREVDQVTNVSRLGNTVTLTANNVSIEPGDTIKLINFPTGTGLNFGTYVVSAATSTTVTYTDYGSGSFSNAWVGWIEKYAGPHWTGSGQWEVINTAGSGQTYRLFSDDGSVDTGFVAHPVVTGSYPHINFQVGISAGAISTTGAITSNNLVVSSTRKFDVKFTLDADPTKTGTYHYVVGANGAGFGTAGHVYASPSYQQIFHDRYVPLESTVLGNSDQLVDWTIVDTPSGGNGVIVNSGNVDSHHPEAIFYSGTTGTGQYHIQACMHSSPSDCAEVTVFVSNASPPAANANTVELVACENDSQASFANVLEVGPTQAHTTLLDFPQTYSGSYLVRLHNEGAGGSPTIFRQYIQVNAPSSGTFTDRHPAFVMCGIPNPTTGELPIIDGQAAVGNSWSSAFVSAPNSIIGIFGQNVGPDHYTGVDKPFSHVLISNIFIRHATDGYTYTDRSGTPGATWGESDAFRPFGLQHFSQIGVRCDLVANCIFDDANTAAPKWGGYCADSYYRGNHLSNYGRNGSFLSHPFYTQCDREYHLLNIEDGTVNGSQGTTCYSSRGTHDVRKYNRCQASTGGGYPGGHSEIQDAQNIINTDLYWGYNGAPNCDTPFGSAMACLGQFGQGDWFAAMQEEHYLTNIDIANAYQMPNSGSKFLSISTTHSDIDLDNSMNGWYGYGTYLIQGDQQGEQFGETQRLATDENNDMGKWPVPFYAPTQYVQNTIIPWFNSCTASGGYSSPFGTSSDAFWFFRSNMVAPGQVCLSSPLHPQWNNYLFPNGIWNNWNWGNPWNIDPLNQQINGTQSEFISYTTFPANTTTLKPVIGSGVVGSATTPVDVFELYKPFLNAAEPSMAPYTLRTDLTTMGAYDPAPPSPPVSIAVTPNPLNKPIGDLGNLVCTTRLADTTTRPCISPSCTSTNAGAMTITGLTWQSIAAGSGNLNCTAETLTAPADPFTVTGGGSPLKIAGSVKLGGSVKLSGGSGSGTTIYVNTVFAEASAGTALAGTTPVICINGCAGPWTLSSGTDWTYQSGGGVATSTANLGNPDLIESGAVNGVMRISMGTCTGGGGTNCQFRFRVVDANNFIAVNATPGSSYVFVYDVVGGTVTTIAGPINGPLTGDYTITYTGSAISVTNPNGTVNGTTANTTGTKVGINLDGTGSMSLSSLSVKSN
jgi:hypothetical protein